MDAWCSIEQERRKLSTTSNSLKPLPPAFPATRNQWHRFIKTNRTINDYVEEMHLILIDDTEVRDKYQGFLWAVYDEQAVEGSLSADNTMAAMMIRDRAREIEDNHPLTGEKLATISKALGVVLRRYHQSRKERRLMVDGEIVQSDSNEKE